MLVGQGYNCTNMRRYCTFMLVKGNIIHSANEKKIIFMCTLLKQLCYKQHV